MCVQWRRWPFLVHTVVQRQYMYSEYFLYDHLRNRDNLGIKDSYFSPQLYSPHRNGPEK